MYKCEALALNCGLCLTLDAVKYECGWCTADKACTRQDKCTAPTLVSEGGAGGWLDRSELCPAPRITDFYPKKGPISGGTKVSFYKFMFKILAITLNVLSTDSERRQN
jgi:plexin A